jgi:hypothetical protein
VEELYNNTLKEYQTRTKWTDQYFFNVKC